MKKVIIIVGRQPMKAYVSLNLFQCHIEWLKKNGINFTCTPETESFVYSQWANENRTHPLLVECLELHKDAVTAGINGMKPLMNNIYQLSGAVDASMQSFANGIVRRTGRGHLSVNEVRSSFSRQSTLDEILDKYAGDFVPKDKANTAAAFNSLQNCQQMLDEAYQTLNDYRNANGLGHFDGCNSPDFNVVEYDETKFEPVLTVEFDAAHHCYHEELLLKPLDIKNGTDVTEAALKFFFENGDFEGLKEYLQSRNVPVI